MWYFNFIETMKNALVETDADMNEVHYFSSEFLVRKFLKGLTEDDLKLNAKLKKKEMEDKTSGQPEDDLGDLDLNM